MKSMRSLQRNPAIVLEDPPPELELGEDEAVSPVEGRSIARPAKGKARRECESAASRRLREEAERHAGGECPVERLGPGRAELLNGDHVGFDPGDDGDGCGNILRPARYVVRGDPEGLPWRPPQSPGSPREGEELRASSMASLSAR
jgi:hypothetical protein